MTEEKSLVVWVGKTPNIKTLGFGFHEESPGAVDANGAPKGKWKPMNKDQSIVCTSRTKGPTCPAQCRPVGLKAARKTEELATTCDGTKCNGLEKDSDGVIVPVDRWLKNAEFHMVKCGMWHVACGMFLARLTWTDARSISLMNLTPLP